MTKKAKKGYVVFSNIDWETDGVKANLPKEVTVPLSEFGDDFDFEQEGADYLSDKYGYCVNGFNFKK